MLFEILKKAQTLLQLIFEHRNLIIQLIPVLTIMVIIINGTIKILDNRSNIDNKTNPNKPSWK